MERLWKTVMRLPAKAFCLAALLVFSGVTAWCALLFLTPQEPFREGTKTLPAKGAPFALNTLAFVSNQLSQESLTIPVEPFRPTMEAIFTNEEQRAAFIKAFKAQQAAKEGVRQPGGVGVAGGAAPGAGKKAADPFAALRKQEKIPGQLVGPNGEKMIKPKISFLGFINRPDGSRVSVFSDSSDHSTHFYQTGGTVHGVDVIGGDTRSATVRLPNGSVRKLEIGGHVTLAPEPMKTPPKKKVATAATLAAAKAKQAKQGKLGKPAGNGAKTAKKK